MSVSREEYIRELKLYLDGKEANEHILRYVEDTLHGISEPMTDDFRRNFAVRIYLYNEDNAFLTMLPNLK